MQKLSSKGSPRFGEAGGPATGWKTKLSRGSMLAVSLIILGIMLVSTLSIALVAVQERKASMGENTSNQAYNKAEDGVEKVMQLMKNNEGGTLSNIDASCANGVITSTEGYTVKFKDATDNFITDCGTPIALVKSVKSIGTVDQNQRAIEVAVAAGCSSGGALCLVKASCHAPTGGGACTATVNCPSGYEVISCGKDKEMISTWGSCTDLTNDRAAGYTPGVCKYNELKSISVSYDSDVPASGQHSCAAVVALCAR